MSITASFTRTEVEAAFNKLASALENTKLPYGDTERHAKAHEFMFMHEEDGSLCFKHSISRNYIALIDGTIQLGDGQSPFQGHDFPPGLDG